jgi:hypothetical protein
MKLATINPKVTVNSNGASIKLRNISDSLGDISIFISETS